MPLIQPKIETTCAGNTEGDPKEIHMLFQSSVVNLFPFTARAGNTGSDLKEIHMFGRFLWM